MRELDALAHFSFRFHFFTQQVFAVAQDVQDGGVFAFMGPISRFV